MYGVPASKEFQRIKALPMRNPDVTEEQIDYMTRLCRKPRSNERLRPIQARGLLDHQEAPGGICAWGVGHGKFLMSMLAFTVQPSTKRPLVLLPAKLIGQTQDEMIKQGKHWRIRPDIRIMSWEKLSRQTGFDELLRYLPDGICGDEVHNIKEKASARTAKFMRYIKTLRNNNHSIWFLGLSGTLINRSLHEAGHIVQMALEDRSPLPRTHHELDMWASAVDEKISGRRNLPGALTAWSNDHSAKLKDVKHGLQKRLAWTPGFSATGSGSLDTALYIHEWAFKPSEKVADAYFHLQDQWETPDGNQFTDPLTLWRHAREICCGFYNIWDPPAPKAWADARKEWFTFVFDQVKSRTKATSELDAPLDVANACDRGELDSYALEKWREIRGSFEPNPVPQWFDKSIIREAEAWAIETGGIVWIDSVGMGKEFKKIPYFGAGDERIRTHKGPCVASISAHFEGKNLTQWSKALIITPPSSGKEFEQLLGRHHRPGQTASRVDVWVFLGCRNLYEGFQQARKDCMHQEDLLRSKPKLNDAVFETRKRAGKGKLWHKRKS